MHFEFDIECMIASVAQIRKRFRLLFRRGGTEWLECVERDDPRRDRGRETLRVEWPERHIFPLLDIAGAPVVQQHHAEDMRLRLFTTNKLAERIPRADDKSRLQLYIQLPACTEHRPLSVGQLDLAARPAHRRTAHDHR